MPTGLATPVAKGEPATGVKNPVIALRENTVTPELLLFTANRCAPSGENVTPCGDKVTANGEPVTGTNSPVIPLRASIPTV